MSDDRGDREPGGPPVMTGDEAGEWKGDRLPEASGAPGGEAGEAATPQGTMALVLFYIAGTAVLWGYMYYILLRSEGFWGGF